MCGERGTQTGEAVLPLRQEAGQASYVEVFELGYELKPA